MQRSIVLLPEPDAPMMLSTSPFSTLRWISRSTVMIAELLLQMHKLYDLFTHGSALPRGFDADLGGAVALRAEDHIAVVPVEFTLHKAQQPRDRESQNEVQHAHDKIRLERLQSSGA